MSSKEEIVETSKKLIELFRKLSGYHPGFRPVHAKGLLLEGCFKPTHEASCLSKAPHFQAESTPIIARFSGSSGVPTLPDTDANANPQGLAIKFLLDGCSDYTETDVATVSGTLFPSKNGKEAVEFFTSLVEGTVEEYIRTHPAAARFVQAPKLDPASFANVQFWSINAFKFVDKEDKETFFRYQVHPRAGVVFLTDDEVKAKPDNYLFDSLPNLIEQGPIEFDLVAQIAEDCDVTDDCTVLWPEERKLVKLGTISLQCIRENNAAEQKTIIYDPMPRVEGVEPSEDPLIRIRSTSYLMSGEDRRAA